MRPFELVTPGGKLPFCSSLSAAFFYGSICIDIKPTFYLYLENGERDHDGMEAMLGSTSLDNDDADVFCSSCTW